MVTKRDFEEAKKWSVAFGQAQGFWQYSTAILAALDLAIAQADRPANVEALKRKPLDCHSDGSIDVSYNAGWNACIDHLASIGALNSATGSVWQDEREEMSFDKASAMVRKFAEVDQERASDFLGALTFAGYEIIRCRNARFNPTEPPNLPAAPSPGDAGKGGA